MIARLRAGPGRPVIGAARPGSDRFVTAEGLALILAVCLLGVVSGCGGRDRRECELNGTITFDGRPVPAGVIVFEPDVTRGNRGPQGFSGIKDGRYDTRKHGKGVSAGAMVVRVWGFDGQVGPAGSDNLFSPGTPLFPAHIVRLDIAKESRTYDFKIPAPPP